MKDELFLSWLSERGQGSMQQFRQSCNWLFGTGKSVAYKPEMRAHTLSVLGHIEVDWRGGRWCAAPPVLTILPDAGAYALLSGARTRKLVERLAIETAEDVTMSVICHRHQQWNAPDALFIATDDERDAEELAVRLNISYEYSVSSRLRQILPSIGSAYRLTQSTPPSSGFGIEVFDCRLLTWLPCRSSSDPGLYRVDFPGHFEYRFTDGRGNYFSPDRATGIYMELARVARSVLSYKREKRHGTLIVPKRAPMPVLQARCAVLCSGLAPTPSEVENSLQYVNVPLETAKAISNSLEQELQILDSRSRHGRTRK